MIATASRAEFTDAMVADCVGRRSIGAPPPPRLIFDANGHALSLRETDSSYRNCVDQADVIHADGGFLVSLSKLMTKTPIAERSGTTDMIHDFAARAATDGLSFYLLGGSTAVNAECTNRLEAQYPGLSIVGRRDGYFSEEEVGSVIEDINRVRPDVLWVGLGKPKEQVFSVKWRDRIDAGWLVTCGGCFNYITGDYARAPKWMQNNNLEWLHRMVTNPRQLLWRYLVTTPHALFIALFKSNGKPHG